MTCADEKMVCDLHELVNAGGEKSRGGRNEHVVSSASLFVVEPLPFWLIIATIDKIPAEAFDFGRI